MERFTRQLEKNHGIETDYVKLLYYDFNEEHNELYRSYELPRLCTIIEGEKKVTINENSPIIYDNQSMILLPPNSSVDMEIKKETKAFVLEFSDELVDSVVDKAALELNRDVNYNPKELIHRDLDDLSVALGQILNSVRADDPRKEFLIDLYVQDIVYRLISQEDMKAAIINQGNQVVRSAIKLMYEGIALKDIPNILHISASNLSHQFRDTFNLTPTQYYNALKMKRAKELLLMHNVTEVSYQLGYNNISYFIRLFKTYFGITPKQFQSRNKS